MKSEQINSMCSSRWHSSRAEIGDLKQAKNWEATSTSSPGSTLVGEQLCGL